MLKIPAVRERGARGEENKSWKRLHFMPLVQSIQDSKDHTIKNRIANIAVIWSEFLAQI